MPDDPEVFDLLQEMVESGKTPEDVCRDRPQLLAEVRRRWKQFRLVDAQIGAFLPDSPPSSNGAEVAPERRVPGMPLIPGYDVEAELGSGGMGVVYKAGHRALVGRSRLRCSWRALRRSARTRSISPRGRGPGRTASREYRPSSRYGRSRRPSLLHHGTCRRGSLAISSRHAPNPPKRAAELIATVARAVAFAIAPGSSTAI